MSTPNTNADAKPAAHTPGPWRVMPCPTNYGKHPFHDHRWIATADAELEFGYDPRPGNWCLSRGSLICEMRDGPPANAALIASAPSLLAERDRLREEKAEAIEAVRWLNSLFDGEGNFAETYQDQLSTALEKARAVLAKVAVEPTA